LETAPVAGGTVGIRADGGPLLLWGSPGTGKSSVVGASLGWPTEGVIGSIREPADFAGTGMHLRETFQIQTAWVLSVGS
jgi:hypothetical protein